MSELKGQSTVAFERLCAHFELGQRRQGEQIEALRQQFERQAAENEVLRFFPPESRKRIVAIRSLIRG